MEFQPQEREMASDSIGTQAVPRVPMPGTSIGTSPLATGLVNSTPKGKRLANETNGIHVEPRVPMPGSSNGTSSNSLQLDVQANSMVSYRDCLVSCSGRQRGYETTCEDKNIFSGAWPKLEAKCQITKRNSNGQHIAA